MNTMSVTISIQHSSENISTGGGVISKIKVAYFFLRHGVVHPTNVFTAQSPNQGRYYNVNRSLHEKYTIIHSDLEKLATYIG